MGLAKTWGVVLLILGSACGPTPIIPFSTKTPPLVLAPAQATGVIDQRPRFRELFCAVSEEIGDQLPDHRSCEKALTRLEGEGPPPGRPVDLGRPIGLTVGYVMGLGGDCVDEFLRPDATIPEFLETRGARIRLIDVHGLSSAEENAAMIRDAMTESDDLRVDGGIVLVGYSKGIVDILVALAAYPELHEQVRAVVSIAGAVGGSPLVDTVPPWLVGLFRLTPGSDCGGGDLGSMESLSPAVRQRWLAENTLPASIPYYSVVTFPDPDRISNGLQMSYEKLSYVDPRNDSQLLFYDQVIPGSRLLGYVNADHLSIVLPIDRAHPWLAELGVDKNDYPREVMIEAILRHVAEDTVR